MHMIWATHIKCKNTHTHVLASRVFVTPWEVNTQTTTTIVVNCFFDSDIFWCHLFFERVIPVFWCIMFELNSRCWNLLILMNIFNFGIDYTETVAVFSGDSVRCFHSSPTVAWLRGWSKVWNLQQQLVFWVVATQIFVIFTPNLRDMIQFDEHIFEMGWNHQLVFQFFDPPPGCNRE